jgi:hypothetical protein
VQPFVADLLVHAEEGRFDGPAEGAHAGAVVEGAEEVVIDSEAELRGKSEKGLGAAWLSANLKKIVVVVKESWSDMK